MWPYLLGHYKFGSTREERQDVDRATAEKYRSITEEWQAVESVIQQRNKDELDGMSISSTGSRDEVYEQLEMIGSGLEKSPTMATKRGSIEEPDIEGLDPEARAKLFNGHLEVDGEGAESVGCDCVNAVGKFSNSSSSCERCGRQLASEFSGNSVNVPNGHDTILVDNGEAKIRGGESDERSLCKQCSQESAGSNSSECPYSVGKHLACMGRGRGRGRRRGRGDSQN